MDYLRISDVINSSTLWKYKHHPWDNARVSNSSAEEEQILPPSSQQPSVSSVKKRSKKKSKSSSNSIRNDDGDVAAAVDATEPTEGTAAAAIGAVDHKTYDKKRNVGKLLPSMETFKFLNFEPLEGVPTAAATNLDPAAATAAVPFATITLRYIVIELRPTRKKDCAAIHDETVDWLVYKLDNSCDEVDDDMLLLLDRQHQQQRSPRYMACRRKQLREYVYSRIAAADSGTTATAAAAVGSLKEAVYKIYRKGRCNRLQTVVPVADLVETDFVTLLENFF